MKNYKYILFDADETLFHFDAYSGLKLTFSRLKLEFTQEDFESYQALNKTLWQAYQNGVITAQELQLQRFTTWAEKFSLTPQSLNNAFQTAMAELCAPLEGAVSLLNALKGKVSLGIITNGFAELQQARLDRIGLRTHFDLLVISEEVGLAKPHPGIFEHALNLLGKPAREEVLMVGDTPESDILGGNKVGIDTCWLNIHNKPIPQGIVPRYQVASLAELEALLVKSIH
jgi:5'-nucleotidase